MSIFSKWRAHREKQRPFCTAIVPAAGSSSRMEGIDKLPADLAGKPVLYHTLNALSDCPLIDEIIVVTREDLVPVVAEFCHRGGFDKVTNVIVGGADRAESVRKGIAAASPRRQLFAIHDGARPLVTQELLEEVILTAARTGAAAPACPIKDTVKQSDGQVIEKTIDRSRLYGVQTPQVFDADLISAALERCKKDGVALTDDCSAAEYMGKQVTLTKGSYENIKVTTPVDLIIGEAILKWREQN